MSQFGEKFTNKDGVRIICFEASNLQCHRIAEKGRLTEKCHLGGDRKSDALGYGLGGVTGHGDAGEPPHFLELLVGHGSSAEGGVGDSDRAIGDIEDCNAVIEQECLLYHGEDDIGVL